MVMADSGFRYAGTQDLHVLDALPGYNRYIARLFTATWQRHTAPVPPAAPAAPAAPVAPVAPRILDFGAGIGTITALFRAQTGISPLTTDADAAHLTALWAQGFATVGRVEDIADGSLDYIFSSNVLEHIDDDRAMLALLHRKLKPRGAIAFYVPAFMSLWSRLDELVDHRRRYTMPALREKLATAGFHVERAAYCDSIGYILARLFRSRVTIAGEMRARTLWLFDKIVFPASRLIDPLFARRFGKNLFIAARRGA